MPDDPRTRIRAPRGLKEMNDGLLDQRDRDELPFDLPVLTVPGRRTGAPRATPLTVHETRGMRVVLGGFPAADWIANLRAAGGHATLSSGRDAPAEPVVLTELPPDEARPILREWPEVAPDGVEMMAEAGVVTEATPDGLAAVAGICPVFRIDPA